MPEQFDALPVVRKTGQERLYIGSEPTQFSLLDFWQWSCSDLANNTLRGRFAEYIVACAMGLNSGIRVEWDAHDLLCVNGVTIEVKSAAYLQSWKQVNFSVIQFPVSQRKSNIYVFCVLHHKDKFSLDALDLSQWAFYVLRTAILDERCPTQKTMSLGTLLKLLPSMCSVQDLRETIDREASLFSRSTDYNFTQP